MGLTFNGNTVVSDSIGDQKYGIASLMQKGDVQQEIYETSFPPSDGIGEVFSGNRVAHHRVNVIWSTTDETEVDNFIDGLRTGLRYGSFTITRLGGRSSFTRANCRLESCEWGPRRTGSLNGSLVMVIPAILTFKQVGGFT